MAGWMNTAALKEKDSKPTAILAIDFDGTIVEHEYPLIGRPNPGAIEVLKELTAKGYRLILLTMRSDDKLHEAIVYCNKNNLDFWAFNENPEQKEWTNSRKVYATLYFDDAGVGMPLMQGTGTRPCVDWTATRQILVEYGMLDALPEKEDGVVEFKI